MTVVDTGNVDKAINLIKGMIASVTEEETRMQHEVSYLMQLEGRKVCRADTAKQTRRLEKKLVEAQRKLAEKSGYIQQLKTRLKQINDTIREVRHHAGE